LPSKPKDNDKARNAIERSLGIQIDDVTFKGKTATVTAIVTWLEIFQLSKLRMVTAIEPGPVYEKAALETEPLSDQDLQQELSNFLSPAFSMTAHIRRTDDSLEVSIIEMAGPGGPRPRAKPTQFTDSQGKVYRLVLNSIGARG